MKHTGRKGSRLTGEAKRLYLMRSALTKATARVGMGGLEKSSGRQPKPVSLPKLPWSEKPEEK